MADKKMLPNILDYFDKDNNLDKSSFIDAFSAIKSPLDLRDYDISDSLFDFVDFNGRTFTDAYMQALNSSSFLINDTRAFGDYLSSYFIDAYEAPLLYLNFYDELFSNNPNDPDLEFLKTRVDKSNDYLNYFFSSANPLDSMRSNDDFDFSISNLNISPFMFCASILIVALCSVWIVKKSIRLYK